MFTLIKVTTDSWLLSDEAKARVSIEFAKACQMVAETEVHTVFGTWDNDQYYIAAKQADETQTLSRTPARDSAISLIEICGEAGRSGPGLFQAEMADILTTYMPHHQFGAPDKPVQRNVIAVLKPF